VHGGAGDIAALAALRNAQLAGLPTKLITAVNRRLAGD
jgi:hypothetical protein